MRVLRRCIVGLCVFVLVSAVIDGFDRRYWFGLSFGYLDNVCVCRWIEGEQVYRSNRVVFILF